MRNKAVLLLALLFCAKMLLAQRNSFQKLDGSSISFTDADSVITQLMRDGKVMGMGIAVLNGNKPVYIKTFGMKNSRSKELLDTATVMYAASLAKAVFAFTVMHLVQDGKIDLDKPLYQYLDKPLPEYDNYKDLAGDDRWKLITARMCLSHTIGFPNWRFLTAHTADYDKNGKLAIYFTPGSRYAYSGEGIALLQLVVEKITGENLQQLAAEKIFIPAGMTRTAYVWQPAFNDNYAEGHDGRGHVLPMNKRTIPNAAGSMVTTVADYTKFVAYVMQGKGLNKKTSDLMISPQLRIHSKVQFPTITDDTTTNNDAIQLSYGLGWGLFKCEYGRAFFKEGHDDGWRHYNVNFPDKKISLIIMTNSANGEGIFRDLLAKLIGDVYTPWKWERYRPYDLTAVK
jgi:CubicO group peptidase (beta-lactamase class C family)